MSLSSPRSTEFTAYRTAATIDRPADRAAEQLPSVPGAAFRSALGQLAAGVNIVTMCDAHGNKLGLTATAVTSVSLDPPLILVCVNNHARSAAALLEGAPFIVHILAAGQEALARHFASPVADKFAELAYHMTPSGSPLLTGALAHIECVSHQIYPGGDHIIVVGRVVDTHISSDASAPLLYFRGQFTHTK